MNVLCDALWCGLKRGSADYVYPDTCIALGFQDVSSQVFAAEAGAATSVRVLGAQCTAWLKTAQTPAVYLVLLS